MGFLDLIEVTACECLALDRIGGIRGLARIESRHGLAIRSESRAAKPFESGHFSSDVRNCDWACLVCICDHLSGVSVRTVHIGNLVWPSCCLIAGGVRKLASASGTSSALGRDAGEF